MACGKTSDTSRCEGLVAELKKDPSAVVVYEPMTERLTSGYATLTWNGLRVPVPIRGIADVILSRTELQALDVFVVYKDKSIITALGAATDTNTFAIAHIGYYEISAAEARCDRPNLIERLLLKTTAESFEVEHAYRVGEAVLLQGVSLDRKRNVWEWTQPSGDMVTYRGPLRDWGYAIANPGDKVAWLSELNTVLASDGADLARLQYAFEQAGFSRKSLDALSALASVE